MIQSLEYESPSREAARWRRRLDPPSRTLRALAWTGVAAIFWGSAGFPGGLVVLLLGIVLAPVGVVPIVVWEFFVRPGLLLMRKPAPYVRGRWWIMLFFIMTSAGLVTGMSSRAAALLLKPIWVPVAEYYYARRPATSPPPKVMIAGPYVIRSPRITPGGIRGVIPGGGEIAITWNETDGYMLRTDPQFLR